MSANDSRLKAWLAEHPRMAGAAFTALVLLSQAGAVVASNSDHYGP